MNKVGPAEGEKGGQPPGSIPGVAQVRDPSLGLLQRLLLTTDGTVVRLLEVCFGETVRLAGRKQFTSPASPTDEDLQPEGHETMLRRTVVLQGSQTARNFVYAHSVIVLDRLEPPVREGLLSTSKPIGLVLAANRTETFKELLRTGRAPAGEEAAHWFGLDPSDELLFRSYRIVSRGLPIMLITEHVPAGEFPAQDQMPAHGALSSPPESPLNPAGHPARER